jgi:hypothetical protein
MESFRPEETYNGGLKGFIPCDKGPGHFPQEAQQIFIVGDRKLRAADEIVVIVEVVVQESHAQRQGQGYGQKEQGMFSQSRHSAVSPIRRKIETFSLIAVNKRFVFKRVLESRQKRK